MTIDALPDPLVLYGVAAPGLGKASHFTSLPWVMQAFADELGLIAWPGTFNVRLSDDRSLELWKAISRRCGIEIEPPDGTACVAHCYRAAVNEVPGAIILPHVPAYPPDQLEIIADRSIRSTLALNDGDPVALRVFGPLGPARG